MFPMFSEYAQLQPCPHDKSRTLPIVHERILWQVYTYNLVVTSCRSPQVDVPIVRIYVVVLPGNTVKMDCNKTHVKYALNVKVVS